MTQLTIFILLLPSIETMEQIYKIQAVAVATATLKKFHKGKSRNSRVSKPA